MSSIRFWISVFCLLITGVSFGKDLEIVGHEEHQILIPMKKSNSKILQKYSTTKTISLLTLHLSNKAQDRFIQKLSIPYTSNGIVTTSYPRRLQLGMNNVPVLDQGSHGTCVTFATTAAVDAALGKGDYVSQYCQLELGRYLENHSFAISGWDGANILDILAQMSMFGIVNKNTQRSGQCGLTEYPLGHDSGQNELSVEDFSKLSEQVFAEHLTWTSLLDMPQVMYDSIDMSNVLLEIKKSLNAGDRVDIGVILIALSQGVVGAVGTYHTQYDTWVMTPKLAATMNEDAEEFAGHAMLITGYDDDAIAIDNEGNTHKGLFTLRNSWGNLAGDHGDFYIAYDYIKPLLIEAERIRVIHN